MNFWLCSNCGKKVAESMKACPYCKALRQQELKVVSSDTKYLKIVIIMLSCIIVGGAIFYFSGASTPTEPKKQFHQVNVNTQQSAPKATSITVPPSAIAAYKALKKVEARTEVGVSNRDYPEVIAEAKVAVNLYLESPESKTVPELTQSLQKAMEHYANAKGLWDLKLKDESFMPNADFREYWKWASDELKKASAMLGNTPQ